MTSEGENRYFNPENATHQRLVDAVVEILESSDKSGVETPALAEKIDEETEVIAESTARSLLYYAREYIVKNRGVETERKAGSGRGSATWEWRLDTQ